MPLHPSSRSWSISLVFCVLLVMIFDSVVMQLQSPCPHSFEYALDENQRLYGRIKINNPTGNHVVLNVELSVGNSVKDYNGAIQLEYGKARAIDEIVSGRPLYYKVHFPLWRVFPPRVTKIFVNGELICSGPPLNPKRVPILTTINLQHSLKISGLSLVSAPDIGSLNSNQSASGPTNSINHINQNPPVSYELPNKENNNGWFFQLGAVNPNQAYPDFLSFLTTEKNHNDNSSPGENHGKPFWDIFGTTTAKPGTTSFAPKPSTTTSTTTQPAFPPESEELPELDIRGNTNDICGRSLSTTSLIANGTPVTRGYFPWLVALYNIKQLNLEFTCGGSLVSTKHVVTAAHCLRPYEKKINIDHLLIILGKYNIQRWTNDKDSLMLSAESVTIHPDYRALSADADIAVITLSQEVRSKKFIRPICLWSEPTDLKLVEGDSGVVAGWGRDENGATLSPEPKQVNLPIVSQVECLRSHDDFADVTSDRTFCAGYRNGSGPCNGDSGGGFMMRRNGIWTLRGVVSMSIADQTRNCDLSQYLVFTDVSKFSDWLLAIINE